MATRRLHARPAKPERLHRPDGERQVDRLQNFSGELRAFHNVCSHRQSRIRSEASGNGPLRCPYHGWTYNSAGIPFSIPNKPLFDAADSRVRDDLSLDRFAVDTCGSLLFVRIDENGPSLRDYLAGAYDHLHAVGSALGEQLSRYPMVIRANWKVIVENTLEGYHVNYVHAHSLSASHVRRRRRNSGSAFDVPLDDRTEAGTDARSPQRGLPIAAVPDGRLHSPAGFPEHHHRDRARHVVQREPHAAAERVRDGMLVYVFETSSAS